MKIVFSRKGFDSSNGGKPSFIFPDGSLFSVPIPTKNDKLTFGDLQFSYAGDSAHKILNQVTNGLHNENGICHHDPMEIQHNDGKNLVLGQFGSPDGELRNGGIDKGDIFLFFGWFKHINKINGRWQYLRDSKNIQLIWSYMEVGSIHRINNMSDVKRKELFKQKSFLNEHPHVQRPNFEKNNSLYVSQQHEMFDYDEKRCLTDIKEYETMSKWRLPSFFNQPSSFTRFKNFILEGDDVIMKYRGVGQEFILNLDSIENETEKNNIIEHVNSIII